MKEQRILKENQTYRLVFERNESTPGVFVIEDLDGNMRCNFSDETEAFKRFEEEYERG